MCWRPVYSRAERLSREARHGDRPVNRPPRTTIRESRGDFIFLTSLYIRMGIVGLVVLYPMVFILGASFSSAKALPSGSVWLWPVHLTFDGYSGLWRTGPVPQALGYSVLYTMGGTSLTLMLTIAMAYPLSRRDFFGRRLLARALAPYAR